MTITSSQASIHISTLRELDQFAQHFAKSLIPGDALALDGTLGVGKTTFVQALCKALNVSELVSSPTYTLINHYRTGRLPILHVDLYRLENQAVQLEQELIENIEEEPCLIIVEWACYGPFLAHYINHHLEFSFLTASDKGTPVLETEIEQPERCIHLRFPAERKLLIG